MPVPIDARTLVMGGAGQLFGHDPAARLMTPELEAQVNEFMNEARATERAARERDLTNAELEKALSWVLDGHKKQ